jgi:hypothetical protein
LQHLLTIIITVFIHLKYGSEQSTAFLGHAVVVSITKNLRLSKNNHQFLSPMISRLRNTLGTNKIHTPAA